MRIRMTVTRVVEFDIPANEKNPEVERQIVERELSLAERDPHGYRPGDGVWVVNGECVRR